MHLREYRATDKRSIVNLFYETVHAVNAKDYTKKQLDVWAPDDIDADEWCKPFEADYTCIAEIGNTLVGFANVDDTGYFDRLYVHKEHQGTGVGKILADEIENRARKNGMTKIKVDASITAKPFFIKRGYTATKQNTMVRNNQTLINFSMMKLL